MMPSPAAFWHSVGKATSQIVVLSGDIGAGKTTWCARLATHVRAQRLHVAGLLSLGVFDAGEKIAIDLLDLSSGEQRRLAVRRSTPDPHSMTRNWQFEPATLAWGDAVLGALNACDLLIIDELGPLELLHNQGWQNAFLLLKKRQYRVACVVVRRALAPIFCERFPVAQTFMLDRTGDSPESPG